MLRSNRVARGERPAHGAFWKPPTWLRWPAQARHRTRPLKTVISVRAIPSELGIIGCPERAAGCRPPRAGVRVAPKTDHGRRSTWGATRLFTRPDEPTKPLKGPRPLLAIRKQEHARVVGVLSQLGRRESQIPAAELLCKCLREGQSRAHAVVGSDCLGIVRHRRSQPPRRRTGRCRSCGSGGQSQSRRRRG